MSDIRRCKIMGCERSARRDDYGYCAKHRTWLPEGHRGRYRILRRAIEGKLASRGGDQ